MPEALTSLFDPSPDIDNFAQMDGEVFCQFEGPKLIFRSLLDSGASYPSIRLSDLQDLGIFPEWYGAQSVCRMMTANGVVNRRIYELHVEIAGNEGTPIVDPANPVNPAYSRYVGGLSPVVLYDGDPLADENGAETNGRLSGIMPFLAPYVSITPSRNTILMGEDRNDVLGGHKMPPTRKWMVGLTQDPTSRQSWPNFGDPLIRFSHRGGRLIDEDIAPGVSRLTSNVGQANEASHLNDPKGAFVNQGVIDPTVLRNKRARP